MKRFAFSGAVLLSALMALFAPIIPSSAQSLLSPFIIRADTSISVTAILADGRTVLVPIDLVFNVRNAPEGAYISLDAEARQQPGMTVVVSKSSAISASVQAFVYATPTPAPSPMAAAIAPPTVNAPAMVVTLTPLPTIALPTQMPLPPETPILTPETILQSLGLGRKYDDWVSEHGQPTRDISFSHIFEDGVGQYTVYVYNERIGQLDRGWTFENFPTFEIAKLEAESLMPRDAIYQSTYTAPSGNLVEVYVSDQLSRAYPDALYTGTLGEFVVIYNNQTEDGKVASFILATGNNP